MRALLTTTGPASHLLPHAPLARACQHTRPRGRTGYDALTRSRAHAVTRLGLAVQPFDEADSAARAPVMAELATNAVGEYGGTTHALVAESHAVRAAQSP